ncbi:MAG: sulfite exporter TauE/SafE family protein [Bacillota bacterium]|nr:sulfite exporter TauE/SafE family protein [Bacillota bacterium]
MTALILTGLACGFINGLFGAGGGVISVLALVKFCNMEKKQAHATTVGVILALSIVSITMYFINGFVDWKISFLAGAGGIIGGVTGAKLLNKLPTRYVSRIFGILMLVSAWGMLRK